jgi:hypothetical protein
MVVPHNDEQLLAPLIPLPCETVHENALPETVLVSAMPGDVPEQIEMDEGVAVATGLGRTVTSTVNVEPAQLLAVGVTVYLTTPSDVPVLVSVCVMVDPEELLKPEMVPPEGITLMAAVQANVVPLTVELRDTLVAVALQIVCAVADPEGIGFTVTIVASEFPVQPFATGVIVYVAVPETVPLLLNT